MLAILYGLTALPGLQPMPETVRQLNDWQYTDSRGSVFQIYEQRRDRVRGTTTDGRPYEFRRLNDDQYYIIE